MKTKLRLKVYAIVTIVLLTFVNCDNVNTKKIIVRGKVIDKLTNRPIRDAKVTVLCWYDAGWDKTDYESINLITKNDGTFEAKFDEGYKVIVGTAAKFHDYKIKEIDSIQNPLLELQLILKSNSDIDDISEIDLRKIIINKTSN